MSLPNFLTLLRMLLVPVIAVVFYLSTPWAGFFCCVLFSFAGFTDWLDGYLSRKWQQESAFGAFLDPVADKLIVAVSLVILLGYFDHWWMVLPTALIIAREITISALREWMAERGERAVVAVSNLGKWKTTFQMVAIGVLLLSTSLANLESQFFYQVSVMIGMLLLYLATALTVWTLFQYLRAALPLMIAGSKS